MALTLPFTIPNQLNSAQLSAQNILSGSNAFYINLTRQMTVWFNLINYNSDQTDCSPDKMWTAFGVQAVKIRSLFQGAAALLNAAQAGTINLVENPAYTLTQNEDGSITAVQNS